MPAKGTAVALPVELEPSPAPAVTAPAPGAAPAQVVAEIQDGQAVASAVTVLCAAVLDRALTPATREAGGERIARVAELWLAHEGDDLEFTRKARAAARCVLRQYYDVEFYEHYSAEQGDAAIDLYIDSVLEIAGYVVKDERVLRAAWAN
jgi:hypothetical protein